VSQAIRAVPANDADATPVPLPTAPPATVEARVDACRDDVRAVQQTLREHGQAIDALTRQGVAQGEVSQRQHEATRRAVRELADEQLAQRATLAAVAAHFSIKGEAIVKEARVTRAIAMLRAPALLAAGALLLRLAQLYLKGH